MPDYSIDHYRYTMRDSGFVTMNGHLEGTTWLDSFSYLYFILAGPAGSSNTMPLVIPKEFTPLDSSITLQLRNSKGVLALVTSGGSFNPYRLYVRHDATNSASIGYLRPGDTMELKLPFRWTSTPKFGDLWSQPYFLRKARMLQTLDYATINLPENRVFEHDEVEVTCKHEGIGKALTKTIRAEYLSSDRRAMRLDLKQLFDENYPMRGGNYNPEIELTNRGL